MNMRIVRKGAWALAASTALLAAGASGAVAQEAAPEGAQAERSGLSEIIVTAQRREQNAQTIPLAVSAFSPMQVEAAQIEDTVDLVRFTPSVTGGLNTGTGSALSFYIRGLGSTEQIASFDVPVATYVDEIYFARQSVNAVSLFDIERVEVLRGPQGTLFGRNTTGGAVSIVTKKPAEEFGYWVEGSLGSYDRAMARGSIDIPVSDMLLTKFSGFVVNEDGYGRSLTTGERLNGEETVGLRAAARVLPNPGVTWDVSADYIDQAKTTLGANPVDPDYASRSGLRQAECDDSIIDTYLNFGLGNCARVQTGGLTSNVAFDLDWATVNLITGYRLIDQNFAIDFFNGTGARGGYVIANEVRNQQLTQEIKLVGGNDFVDWVAGLFYLDENNKTAQIDFFGVLLSDWKMYNTTESLAAYAQGDFHLTDALTLTVGGRYTEEDKTIRYLDTVRAAYPAGLVLAFPTAANRPSTANLVARGVPLALSEGKFTPRVALTLELADDKIVYASATNGFKSGGWNTRVTNVGAVTAFGPEEATTYELGTKTEWLDGTLRLNATAYFQEVKDLQLLSGTGDGQFLTRNSGDMEAYGLELEFAAAPTDQLEIFGTVSGSKSEYVNVPARTGAGNAPCSNRPEPLNCTTVNDDPVRYPSLQGTLGVSYTVPLPTYGGSITANGALSYSQTYWTSTYNDTPFVNVAPFGTTTPRLARLSKVPPTSLLNLGLVYRSEAQHWEAALECSNCTEEYYPTSSLFGLGYWNDPRRFTFRLRYTY